MRNVVFHPPEGAIEDHLRELVPVAVLDGTLELKQTTQLGQALPLEPGLYAARATLPNGRRLEAAFKVATEEGEAIDVTLARTDDAVETAQQDAPVGQLERLKTLDVADLSRIAAQFVGGSEAPDTGRTWVRIGYGNPFGRIRWQGASRPYAVGDEFEVAGDQAAQVIMQLKPSLWRVVAPVLPLLPDQPVDHRLLRMVPRQGSAFPHFHFKNPDLEMLLRYLASDSQVAVNDLAASERVVAKRAFDDPGFKPLAAAAGAYALLRLGRLDELDWTPQLSERFPWMPDSYAILGEWRARRGEHAQAQEAFLRMPDVGLPYFSMGLSDAVNRLSQYASAALEPASNRAAVLAKLDEMAARTDFARPITTYRA